MAINPAIPVPESRLLVFTALPTRSTVIDLLQKHMLANGSETMKDPWPRRNQHLRRPLQHQLME